MKTRDRNPVGKYMIALPQKPKFRNVRDYLLPKKGKKMRGISEIDKIAYEL